MRNLLILLGSVLLVFPGETWGQDLTGKTLIRLNAPEAVTWSVEVKYPDKAVQDDSARKALDEKAAKDPALAAFISAHPQLASTKTASRVIKKQVTQNAGIRKEDLTFEDGRTSTTWEIRNYRFTKSSDDSQIYVTYSGGSLEDFPELDWITRQTPMTVVKTDDRSYNSFEQEVDSSQIEDPTGYSRRRAVQGPSASSGDRAIVVALVDAKTSLPVTLTMGKTIRTYRFSPPEALAVPDEVTALLKSHEKR